jgi:hypothetical protein
MDFIKWILSLAFISFGVFIIVAAYIRQIGNYKNRRTRGGKCSSPAPFIGPIFVMVGLTWLSVDLSAWLLLLFLLDPDTVVVVLGLPWLLKQMISRS